VLSKMQLICETLFPPRMSVTITFLTYSSYTSQSIAVVTTDVSHVTHQHLISYISAISKPIHFWFAPNLCCSRATKLAITGSAPNEKSEISNKIWLYIKHAQDNQKQ